MWSIEYGFEGKWRVYDSGFSFMLEDSYFMLLLWHRGVFHIDTCMLMKVVSHSRNAGSYYVPEETNKKYNTIH